MINDLLNNLKSDLPGQLASQFGLEKNKVGVTSDVLANTFKDGLAKKAGQGQFDDILGLLGKGGATGGFANSLISDAIANMVSKAGLPKAMATKIANFAMPFIISKFGGFANAKGKNNQQGMQDLLGDLLKGSLKDQLLGGLVKKYGL